MKAIVAVYGDWGIGKDGTQPIALSADRKFFRQTTKGACVIVGRRTVEDFPGKKPLPGRTHLVLSRQELEIPGMTTVHSPGEALSAAKEHENVFVIGGGSVYRQMLPWCDQVYVTKLSVTPESDTWFPNLDLLPQWDTPERLQSGKENGISYEILLYRRRQFLQTEDAPFVTETPWQDYPRPQMRRESYVNLNGFWDFALADGDDIAQYPGKILVPFPPEAPLSGIPQPFRNQGKPLRYRRFFTLPEGFRKDRVLLHFGAVDQVATVYVNQQTAGTHEGGYLPFTLDITRFLREGANELTVVARDDLDPHFPYGKQAKTPGGMWYTPFSGIWQTVWLESVPRDYIRSVRVDAGTDRFTVAVDGTLLSRHLIFGDRIIPFRGNSVTVPVEDPHLWSPEDPYLYRFSVVMGEDRVESYFALRSLEQKTVDGIPRLCLNGKPFFFHGLLDQGYFPDGLCLPATPDGYRKDILAAKRLGFNTLRKHIKIEPEQFYYECDRLGMIVWQDMVNSGKYRFLRDTALPTLGWKRRDDTRFRVPDETRRFFEQHMLRTAEHLGSHPCICQWTVFNEGWGQFASDRLCAMLLHHDGSRFVDAASGWFSQKHNPLTSLHVYFRRFKMPKSEKPVALTEFGGFVWKEEPHSLVPGKAYGYRSFGSIRDYRKSLLRLYREEILPAIPKGLCAAVYTQLTDVENECNGLFTYDRKVCKVSEEDFRRLAGELKNSI